MVDINKQVGLKIKQHRQKKGLTQEELAYLAEIDYKYLQRLEGKKPSSPTLNTLKKLTKALKIPLSKLVRF